jgi:hypothetical protein
MTKRFVIALCTGALGLAAPSARADADLCTAATQDQWVRADEIKAKYAKIIEGEFLLEVDDGCYEAQVSMSDEIVLEIYIDPVTAEIVKIEKGSEDS